MERIPEIKNIVEIGPEGNPVFHRFRNGELGNLEEGSRYVAIDCEFGEIKKFSRYHGLEGYSIQGDMRNLPLPSNFADQIWLMNVFGDFRNNLKVLPNGSLQYSLDIDDVFQELARVVKKNGTIHIGEIYPPIKEVSWLTDADYSDFGLEKKVYFGTEKVKYYSEKIGATKGIFDTLKNTRRYTQFFIELKKKG